MKKIIELKGVDLQNLLGAGDVHLTLIEDIFSGQIIARGDKIHLDGTEKDINIVHDVLHEMMQTLNRKGSLTKKDVRQLIHISNVENGNIKEKLNYVAEALQLVKKELTNEYLTQDIFSFQQRAVFLRGN